MADDMKNIFNTLDQLLRQTDLTDVSADTPVFEELKDGYYFCEVEKAELKTSKSGKPMATFKFKTAEDGKEVLIGETGEVTLIDLPKTKNRSIFLNFVLSDETSIRRFVTNMLKFEGDEPGEPILPKEAFSSSDTIQEALEVLVGLCIYVQISSSLKEDGSKSTWTNLISWKRANALELPL